MVNILFATPLQPHIRLARMDLELQAMTGEGFGSISYIQYSTINRLSLHDKIEKHTAA